LPQALNDAILMSVAKDPAMRFQTAGAFRAALGSILPSKQAITQPPLAAPAFQPMAPVAMVAPTPKSKRGLWMAAGALAAALGAVAVIQFGPWKDTKAQTPISQAQPPPTAPAQTPTAQPAVEPTPTPASTPPQPIQQPTPVPAVAKAKPVGKTAPSQTVAASPLPTQVQPTPPVAQPAVQPPVAPQPIAQQIQKPAEPQPAMPSRAEMMAARERRAQLEARVSGIRTSLQSLQRSQAASGLNLSSRFTEPASLMDTYLKAASDALHDSDLASAKDFMDKAERQVEILEKLLNR
jgi:eukaryotic-like serine/threonine-protein kinase